MARLIVVVGMPSGGTSLVAGMLHKLGVDMGRLPTKVEVAARRFPRAYDSYECQDLEAAIKHMLSGAEMAAAFHGYISNRLFCAIARQGVKNPRLLHMVGPERFPIDVVHVRRRLEDVFESDMRHTESTPQRAAALGASVWAMRRFLSTVKPVLALDFEAALAAPEQAVAALVDSLGLAPTTQQLQAAQSHAQRLKMAA